MNYECYYCKEYYKYEIYSNIDFFLKQLEKEPEVLTSEEKKMKILKILIKMT